MKFNIIAALCDWLKHLAPPSYQSEIKPKPIVTCSHAFSRAWCRLHEFALSCDWFIRLYMYVMIGQSVTVVLA